MSTDSNIASKTDRKPDKKITVKVNNKPVRLHDDEVTGLEVKQNAIAQGVAIELDFELALEFGQGGEKIIGDSDVVKVSNKSKFLATAPDDNS